MNVDSSAPVLADARNLPTSRQSGLNPELAETALREIAMFMANTARTRYGEYRANGYFIGSGVIEAGCLRAC
jgi:hypothetical protein